MFQSENNTDILGAGGRGLVYLGVSSARQKLLSGFVPPSTPTVCMHQVRLGFGNASASALQAGCAATNANDVARRTSLSCLVPASLPDTCLVTSVELIGSMVL